MSISIPLYIIRVRTCRNQGIEYIKHKKPYDATPKREEETLVAAIGQLLKYGTLNRYVKFIPLDRCPISIPLILYECVWNRVKVD